MKLDSGSYRHIKHFINTKTSSRTDTAPFEAWYARVQRRGRGPNPSPHHEKSQRYHASIQATKPSSARQGYRSGTPENYKTAKPAVKLPSDHLPTSKKSFKFRWRKWHLACGSMIAFGSPSLLK